MVNGQSVLVGVGGLGANGHDLLMGECRVLVGVRGVVLSRIGGWKRRLGCRRGLDIVVVELDSGQLWSILC